MAFLNSPLKRFLALCILLALPFYLSGWDSSGLISRYLSIDLPISAFIAFVPFIAALIVCKSRLNFIKEIWEFAKIRRPVLLIPLFLFMHFAVAVTYMIAKTVSPELPPITIDAAAQLRFFALFYFAAIGEEMGWTAFAFNRLLANYTPLVAALIVSVAWMAWHLIPYIQTGRDAVWIVSQMIGSIFERLVLYYVFLKTGRAVSIAIIFHTLVNMSEFTFPINGSMYNAPIMLLVVMPFGIWAAWQLRRMRLNNCDYTPNGRR